jgi:hypothetical protein
MKKIFLSGIAILALTASCTENSRVKRFGGVGEIDLPQGKKLVNITWKQDEIWYLTRNMRNDEVAETYQFQEESSWGVVEGTYIIHESK